MYNTLYRVFTAGGRVCYEYVTGYHTLAIVHQDVSRGDYGPGEYLLLPEDLDPSAHRPEDVRWRGGCQTVSNP